MEGDNLKITDVRAMGEAETALGVHWFGIGFSLYCRVFSVYVHTVWGCIATTNTTAVAAAAVAAVLHIDEQTKRKPFAIKAYKETTPLHFEFFSFQVDGNLLFFVPFFRFGTLV